MKMEKKLARSLLRQGLKRKTEGQAFLELTLVLPIIFVLVLGMIAIGLALSYKMKVEAVAREATRVIAKNTAGDSVGIGLERSELVARQYGFDLNQLKIDISGVEDAATPTRGGRVNATVTYHYKMFNLVDIQIIGKNTETIECWRKRGDDYSGNNCGSPGE